MSFISTVGNYEYGFFWSFYQDGTIQCEVKLTGIMNTTALQPGEEPEYGVEISARLKALFHQHIFAVRLNTKIDGDENSIYKVNAIRIPRGQPTCTAMCFAPRRRCWPRSTKRSGWSAVRLAASCGS